MNWIVKVWHGVDNGNCSTLKIPFVGDEFLLFSNKKVDQNNLFLNKVYAQFPDGTEIYKITLVGISSI